jgi:hypothetical protein
LFGEFLEMYITRTYKRCDVVKSLAAISGEDMEKQQEGVDFLAPYPIPNIFVSL